MSKQSVKTKGAMNREQLVAYLEDLTASLKAGKIRIQHEDQVVTLCPEQVIDVEVKASVKKGKEKIEMELAWRKEAEPLEAGDMKIAASEPQPRPATTEELPAVSGPAIEAQPVMDSGEASGPEALDAQAPESEEKPKPGKKGKKP